MKTTRSSIQQRTVITAALCALALPMASIAALKYQTDSYVQDGLVMHPIVLMWKLTGKQEYIDVVSQMMDYALGLNPLGKCYMTTLGFNQVHWPHDRESANISEP